MEVQAITVAGLQVVDEQVIQRDLLQQVFQGFVGLLGRVRLLTASLMVMP
ncbi:hypothetical protein [Pseudomonas indica]|nr:hypothetical protein [Pseudomonas indica]